MPHLARLDFIANLTLVNILHLVERKMLCAILAMGSPDQILALLFGCFNRLGLLFLVGDDMKLFLVELAAKALFVSL